MYFVLQILIFQMLSAANGQDSLCSKYPNFWTCSRGTAKLDGQLVAKRIPFLKDISERTITARFAPSANNPDWNIEHVVIDTDVELTISALDGPEIVDISISGGVKHLKNLCPFLGKHLNPAVLPRLRQVTIHDTKIVDFEEYQDCGNDNLFHPLHPDGSESVKITMRNVNVVVDPRSLTGNVFVNLDRLYYLSELALHNVTFENADFLLKANANTKITGEDIHFDKAPVCHCEFAWKCKDPGCQQNSIDEHFEILDAGSQNCQLEGILLILVGLNLMYIRLAF